MSIVIRHNSWNSHYRDPFGARPCGSQVRLRLAILNGQAPEAVLLHLRSGAEESVLPMAAENRDGDRQLYQVQLHLPKEPGLVHYYFSVQSNGSTWFYGNNRDLTGGRGEQGQEVVPPYRITLYRPGAKTPDWFKDTILYQIYVDRFHWAGPRQRGDGLPRKSLLHLDWGDVPFYIRDPQTQAIRRWDYFGGNLEGVLAKMDYLQSLGVGCIYFNPIFHAHSNHKYDTADYLSIDPGYGGEEAFQQLTAAAAAGGLRIILDGVFSHTGSDSIYFNQEGSFPGLGAYQSPESPYYPWYKFTRYPETYEAWWGVKSLPNVAEMEPTYREFILHGEDSVIRHWMKRGVAGWRLDVADELPDAFIRELRQVVKGIDPDAVVLGEVWEDASEKVSYGRLREYLGGDELDSVTNYPFRSLVLDFFLGRKDARQTGRALLGLYENYPWENFYALLNPTGSHDLPRILTQLGEAPAEESLGLWEQAEYRLSEDQRRLALARLRLFSLLQFTFPGVPGIYYGDEAGMEGFRDPFNRGPFPWGEEDGKLQSWFQALARLRRGHPALRTGEMWFLNGGPDVFCLLRCIRGGRDVFGRELADGIYLILINGQQASRQVDLDLSRWGRAGLTLLLAAREQALTEIPAGGRVVLDLLPLQGLLYRMG